MEEKSYPRRAFSYDEMGSRIYSKTVDDFKMRRSEIRKWKNENRL